MRWTVPVLSYFFYVYRGRIFLFDEPSSYGVRSAFAFISFSPKFYWCHLNKFAFRTDLQFRYTCIDTCRHTKTHFAKWKYPGHINIIIDMCYQQNLIYFMILMPMWRVFYFSFFLFCLLLFSRSQLLSLLPLRNCVIEWDTSTQCERRFQSKRRFRLVGGGLNENVFFCSRLRRIGSIEIEFCSLNFHAIYEWF